MTSQNRLTTIRTYLQSIADTHATGRATEHSYRPVNLKVRCSRHLVAVG